MKQMASDPVTYEAEPLTAAAAGEVTISSFLAAADRLKDKVTIALKAVGLSWPKYEALMQLRQANGSLPLRVLADCQGCAASNITQIIDRLETDGFVRRVDDPDDRRSVRAELTSEGEIAVAKGAAQIELLRGEYRAQFSPAERAELGRLIAKI
jgi:DNA-binding MarR family transcriptional regulator